MRRSVFKGIAVLVVAAVPAQSLAQVQSGSGFFGFAGGGYLFEGIKSTHLSNASSVTRPGDGFAVDGKVGYAFGGGWDVALGGSFDRTYAGDSNLFGFRLNKGKSSTVDGEFGYTAKGTGYSLRPALGLRYLRVIQESEQGPLIPTQDRARGRGIGPHLGLDAAINLTGRLSLVGGIDAAFLYGKVRSTPFIPSFSPPRTDSTRLISQIGGRIGLDWEVAPLVHIAAGYRLTYTDGATFETLVSTSAVGAADGRGRLLDHGLFLRLAYNFGAPSAGAAP